VVAAGLLFATSSVTYEIPLWATGLFLSLSTTLYLVTLSLYTGFCARPTAWRYAAFVAGFALTLLAHEQGVTLLFACVLYRLLVVERAQPEVERRRRVAGWLRQWALPALLLLAFVAFKLAYAERGLLVSTASLKETIWYYRINVWRLLTPNATQAVAATLDDFGRAFLALRLFWWMLLAGVGWLAVRRSPARRFLLAWILLHVGVMTWAVLMESRHFNLPLAPATIFLASVVRDALRRVLAWGRGSANCREVWREYVAAGLLVALTAGAALVGISELSRRRAIWKESSALAQRIVQTTLNVYAQSQGCKEIYLLNLPDSLPISPTEVAYVFRNGQRRALQLAGLPSTVAVARIHTDDAVWTWEVRRGSDAGRVTEARIEALSRRPETLVMRYAPAAQNVQAVGRP
jgi:hypothetical protein